MPRYTYRRKNYLSKSEVAAMISHAEEAWLKSLIAFLYLYGVRITEALRLVRSDFTYDSQYLHVHIGILKRQSDTGPIEPSHILRISRDSPFMKLLFDYVLSKRAEQKVWKQHRGHVWRKIKKLNNECSPHFFRHSRLFHLAQIGATEADLMDWAGWSDPRPAGKYIKATGKLASAFSNRIK